MILNFTASIRTMPLDFDPTYYTETMVRILREQGSTQHATELAEKILLLNPENTVVRQLLDELQEEARKAFERFKNSGRPFVKEDLSFEGVEEVVEKISADLGVAKDTTVPIEPAIIDYDLVCESAATHLSLVPKVLVPDAPEHKLQRLEKILENIQKLKKR